MVAGGLRLDLEALQIRCKGENVSKTYLRLMDFQQIKMAVSSDYTFNFNFNWPIPRFLEEQEGSFGFTLTSNSTLD